MGSVNLDILSKKDTGSVNYVWSDLSLDLNNDVKIKGNFENNSTKLVDIKISYDVEAIFNSLYGLFNTTPGQRLLLPEYGLDLRRLLFRPITEQTARVIGETIRNGIEKWEPRVTVEGVTIQPNPEEHSYIIGVDLHIPLLKRTEAMTGRFIQGQGFIRG